MDELIYPLPSRADGPPVSVRPAAPGWCRHHRRRFGLVRVVTPNPLWEIEVAVNRVYPDTRGESEPFLPEERLAPDAIAAFTAGTAYVNHLDDETGTLEAGKLADVAVLDRDLFDRGVGDIGDARVVATFVEGVAVFEDDLEA